MSRKERLAAKHAAGRGKGRATPKNTPGGMTRNRLHRLNARRVDAAIRATGTERALEHLLGLAGDEQAALEVLTREAGGIILAHRKAIDEAP